MARGCETVSQEFIYSVQFGFCNEYICRKYLAMQMAWRLGVGWYSPVLLNLRPGFESWSVRALIPRSRRVFFKAAQMDG